MRHRKVVSTAALTGLIVAACLTVMPTAATKPPADPTRDQLLLSAGFLTGHPDLRYRLLGLKRFKAGETPAAFKFYQRAAYYADKPSQGMVAEMLWTGQGVAQDRALAYAWMDLAAERGYAGFRGLRELYWSELGEEERARAIREGEGIYAKYGDAVAQSRLATVLRRERRRMTGSRTGFTGNLQIYIPGPDGFTAIDGSKFYDERYWDPKQYQTWHDNVWMNPRVGRVNVGDIQQIREQDSASRIPQVMPDLSAEEPSTPEQEEADPETRKDD